MSFTSKAVTRMILDMGKVDIQKSVAFTKGDVNRRWEVTLIDNGVPFELPRNWTVALSAIKPDETSIYNGCVVEHGKIIYDFASGEQIATSEGTFAAQFDVFDETGEPVCSPRVWIHILPVSRNLAPIESDPQFTVIRRFIEKISEVNADIAEMRERIVGILTMGKITVLRSAFTGTPPRAAVKVPGMENNTVTLLFPADELSRAEIEQAELSAGIEDMTSDELTVVIRGKEAPKRALVLVYTVMKADRKGEPLAAATLVGMAAGDGTPGSLKYVSDGNGRVTVYGKMVEMVDATARNQIEELRREFGQEGGEQEERIETLEGQVADLLYKPMAIQSFTNNVNSAEIGSTVKAVTLAWAYNKTPVSATLDGETIEPAQNGLSSSGLSIKENKTWMLKATDERGAEATKTTGITFLNGVYYGAAAAPEAIDSAFILGLNKVLRGSKLPSFTVNAGEGEHIYYCVPKRFGTCQFTYGGFVGGIDLLDTISFTNASGYTEDYYVYRSAQANLGNTTWGVS